MKTKDLIDDSALHMIKSTYLLCVCMYRKVERGGKMLAVNLRRGCSR